MPAPLSSELDGSERPTPSGRRGFDNGPIRLLLVTGSTRHGSTNSAALRTAAELLDGRAEVVVHEALGSLPPFNPDDDRDPLPPAVAALRDEIAAADVVVFCTPEYAGTLPGTLKNLLDWTVGGGEMDGRRATWINVAGPGRGTGADATLSTVLGYVNAAILPSSGARVPVARDALGDDGRIADATTRERLAAALEAILAEAVDSGASRSS
jgi:chromate reductase, NAD(P)H dehydrogenase (quinone)